MPEHKETAKSPRDIKIVLPGGAGLVGQNLCARLTRQGYTDIHVIDKHQSNLETLRQVQPAIHCHLADLAEPGSWQQLVMDADVVVMLQAQIGGLDYQDFHRNNVLASRHIIEAIKASANSPYLVHISSSVVESVADDFYSRSKREQEQLVLESGIKCPILRPTLMFGWFDRKHLGWLSRFMQKVPVFPIPGHGRYIRQPLYVGDFCDIIIACIEQRAFHDIYNISGQEHIHYIDMIRQIRDCIQARCMIIKIPYRLFHTLLAIWSVFDKNPPFTTQQLAALVARDEFEIIDWPGIFGVPATPYAQAIQETFHDPKYGQIKLEF